jgi:hypothetical protein
VRALRPAILALSFVSIAALASADPPECISRYGKATCGFECQEAHGRVACASTPLGTCYADDSQLLCWDPSPAVRAHFGDSLPRPECTAAYGTAACGYGCVAAFGQVKCAQTPLGACIAEYGKVECFDPAQAEFVRPRGTMPKASCVYDYGAVACGYGCAAANGQLRCARSPEGACMAHPGGVACVDPPPPIVARPSNAASRR